MMDHDHAAKTSRQVVRDARGAISAAIIDDDDFVGAETLTRRPKDFCHSRREPALFIPGRHDDRQSARHPVPSLLRPRDTPNGLGGASRTRLAVACSIRLRLWHLLGRDVMCCCARWMKANALALA